MKVLLALIEPAILYEKLSQVVVGVCIAATDCFAIETLRLDKVSSGLGLAGKATRSTVDRLGGPIARSCLILRPSREDLPFEIALVPLEREIDDMYEDLVQLGVLEDDAAENSVT